MVVGLEDIDERLQRLEDRMRVNFFDIEKRLTNLESGASDEISELKERIAELEDLQMLLELENTKLKENLGVGSEEIITKPHGIEELEKRISTLEEKILLLSEKY